ncbi:MAG TPA: SpvB/TcaC N-terminal domain-containing protein, partial [Bacteroidia bacterium]|nr:SpvB/TcaC N-terminal domain-containing protein [Bacteroidia bacterium]
MSSPISTPKGGGAVSGLGEKFSPDLFTGTGNFSIPIALPPGRNGFQPELGLQYSTGSGNSPFGLGWSLSVPGVMRKTAKGVPAYDDEKDTFILSGAEDLVAVERFLLSSAENKTGIIPLQNEEGVINQYRPRTEGLFARIYHLKTNLRNCWKVMSKNGLISWYGSKQAFDSDLSLVQKPGNSNSIFAWKLTLTEDPFGNHIVYTYEKENVRDNDYHRWDQNYLSEVKYADYPIGNETRYMVCVRFNYKSRVDAYSDYKCGFNIRTTQRCETIQIFTNPQHGEIKTRTYHFQYSDELLPVSELPYNAVSLLCKVEVEGHDEAKGTNEFLPPLEFRYSHFKPKQQKFKQLQGNEMPLASLANPGFELIDLFGNGLPDIVQINGVVRYWRNMGDGKFDIPRLM